jgi:DNA-binding transcriptional LysR family regulator
MRINFELLDMRAFVTIAELRSFRSAAEVLGVSQPVLSRRLKGLEQALGVTLLERSTRHVVPTIAGRQLAPIVRSMISELEASVLSLNGSSSDQQACVAIACIATAAVNILPRVIENFYKQFPKVRFRILDLPTSKVLESVAKGEVEFGVNILGTTHADVAVTPLLQDPYVLVCRRDTPLARKRRITWRDLLEYRLIGMSRSSGNRIVLDNALTQSNIQIDWFYEVDRSSTAFGLTAAGMGAAVVPRLAISPMEDAIILARPIVEPIVRRTLGVLQRRSGRLSVAAQCFRDQLLIHCRDKSALY